MAWGEILLHSLGSWTLFSVIGADYISHTAYSLDSGNIARFTTRNLCFVCFSQVQKRPFLPGGKRNEKKSFFRGCWRLWNPSCVLFLSWFPYAWPPEGGQAPPANFLSGNGTNCDRDTNRVPSSPTPTPLTLLSGAAEILTLNWANESL